MNIIKYIQASKAEMEHVKWPTGKTTMYFTILVIIASLLIAAYLGIFDYIFGLGLEEIIRN